MCRALCGTAPCGLPAMVRVERLGTGKRADCSGGCGREVDGDVRKQRGARNDNRIRFRVAVDLPLYAVIWVIDRNNRFTAVNDGFGHDIGDLVVTKCAQLVAALLRSTDSLACYGDEEFLVVCPETGMDGAAVLAEMIRASSEGYPFPQGGGLPSVSGGHWVRQGRLSARRSRAPTKPCLRSRRGAEARRCGRRNRITVLRAVRQPVPARGVRAPA